MNIFHCCVQKTASQWIRRIFNDPRIQEISGLKTHDFYQDLKQEDSRLSSFYAFTEPFPDHTIVTPLYINFESFCTIPKPNDYRAFFVIRDPRDLIVSWYFSTKYSHKPIGKIQEQRDQLAQKSIQEGLLSVIDNFSKGHYFFSLESWLKAPVVDENVLLIKFEDLTSSDNVPAFEALFQHCKIPVQTDVIQQVLYDVRFEKLAKRKQGVEDLFSHYRKGIEGDWVNYFDDEVEEKFNAVAGELTAALGYHTTKVDLLRKQLAQAQLHLQQAQIEIQELQQTNQGLKQNSVPKPPLSREEIELSQAVAKLSQSQANLLNANQRAKTLKTQLQRTRRRLEHAHQTIAAMESSKFWQLRNQWIKLRKFLSLSR